MPEAILFRCVNWIPSCYRPLVEVVAKWACDHEGEASVDIGYEDQPIDGPTIRVIVYRSRETGSRARNWEIHAEEPSLDDDWDWVSGELDQLLQLLQ